MRRSILISLILIWIVLPTRGHAQEESEKKYPIRITGGINAGGELYGVSGIENRRPAWSYTTSGRLGMTVGKFKLPISFAYRDNQFLTQLQNPFAFNRIGASPTLGWATVHLGWRSMYFSEYTLGGRTFFGVGTELRPGKFQFSALYGTLQNPLAVRRDEGQLLTSLIPIFDRKLMGAKIGYRSGKHHLELMGVRITDEAESFDYPEAYDRLGGYNQLTPKENLLAGVNGGFEVAKMVELYFHTGLSAFTADQRNDFGDLIEASVPDAYRDLLTVNGSTRISFAGDAGINFRLKGTTAGLQYRRVEPFYTTLAANFFYNDVEQYTGRVATGLLNRKLLLNGHLGVERNNLRARRLNRTLRIIGNATASYRPGDRTNLNLTYANFTTESDPDVLQLNDTLRYVTASHNANFNGSYRIDYPGRQLTFTSYLFFQRIDDRSPIQRIGEVDTYGSSVGVDYAIPESGWLFGGNLQFYHYGLEVRSQRRYALGGRLVRKFRDDWLTAKLSSTLSQNDIEGARDGTVGLHSLDFRLRVSERQSVSLYNAFRHSHSISRRSFREWRSRLRYGLRF